MTRALYGKAACEQDNKIAICNEELQMRTAACALAAVTAIWVANPMPAVAQQWPDKPVRILVPFPPGGGTDIQARLLSTAFQKSMGQNFIVDNRTGASGLIASQLAVESPRRTATPFSSRPAASRWSQPSTPSG